MLFQYYYNLIESTKKEIHQIVFTSERRSSIVLQNVALSIFKDRKNNLILSLIEEFKKYSREVGNQSVLHLTIVKLPGIIMSRTLKH